MALIHTFRPPRMILAGIAGSFCDTKLPVGSATDFEAVVCEGVGVGTGRDHQPAGQLGWKQWPGDTPESSLGDRITLPPRNRSAPFRPADDRSQDSPPQDSVPQVGEPQGEQPHTGEVDRRGGDLIADDHPPRVLLSVCAASADPSEAADRLRRYPDACAEDMEGFGVALSCRLERVPLQIVRGVSNRVGDRDHGRWEIDSALLAAAILIRQIALTPISPAFQDGNSCLIGAPPSVIGTGRSPS